MEGKDYGEEAFERVPDKECPPIGLTNDTSSETYG
jgi:hypothetical protein